MKLRFKNDVEKAFLGRLPKDWEVFSDEELAQMARVHDEVNAIPGFRESLGELFTGLDGIDDDTVLSPIPKNSQPQQQKM